MSSIGNLENLKTKMNEIANQLGDVYDNLTKALESNAQAICVNSVIYKNEEIKSTKQRLEDQIRNIKQNIVPSLENEIRELEELEKAENERKRLEELEKSNKSKANQNASKAKKRNR